MPKKDCQLSQASLPSKNPPSKKSAGRDSGTPGTDLRERNPADGGDRPRRWTGIDLARAMAILGMIVVHFIMVLRPDGITDSVALKVLDGRPATLFMLLAGVGVTLYVRSVELESQVRATLIRRGVFLLLFGFANLVVWPGDILRVYGLTFLFVAPFVFASSRTLIGLSVAFAGTFVGLLLMLDYGENWIWETFEYHGLWTGSGILRNLLFDGFRSFFPWGGILILGMAVGRLPLNRPRVQAIGLAVGVTLWIGAEAISAVVLPRALELPGIAGHPENLEAIEAFLGTGSMPPLPLFLASSLGTALVVLSSCLYLAERYRRRWPVRVGVAAGQLAFTGYIAHVYVGVLVLHVAGYTVSSDLLAVLAGAGYFAVFALLAWRIRASGRRGPLESLLRRVCG